MSITLSKTYDGSTHISKDILCYASIAMLRLQCLYSTHLSTLKIISHVKKRNQSRPWITINVLKRHLPRLQSRNLVPRAHLERLLAKLLRMRMRSVKDFVVRLVLGSPRLDVL